MEREKPEQPINLTRRQFNMGIAAIVASIYTMKVEATDQTSFTPQFAKTESLKLAGGTAEVVDIKPENPKTEIPVFFAPGWGSTTTVYKPALETLSQTNRRIITVNHPRRGGSIENLLPEEEQDKYPTEGLRKAFNILGILEQKGIDKTDVIAHSEGAINTVIAATLHPEKFRNIVLFAPAGLIGEDKFTRLLHGFAGQIKRAETLSEGKQPTMEEEQRGRVKWPEIPLNETEKQVASTAIKEAIKYLTQNPIRGVSEALDITKSQIHGLLRNLHEKGVGVVVMSGVDDPVFPMDKMQKIAKSDMLDGFLSLRAGHGEIGTHPEHFVTAAEGMLTSLEEKRNQNTK